MKIIICLDDNNGMLFNNRRQSRDKNIIMDIEKHIENKCLLIDNYSKNLFEYSGIKLKESLSFLDDAGEDDICFVENKNISQYVSKIKKIIIYRWNRSYPFDFTFDIDLKAFGFKLVKSNDLVGNSHEKITKDVYEK